MVRTSFSREDNASSNP